MNGMNGRHERHGRPRTEEYRGGILVKIIAAGRSKSGRTYPAHVLAAAARLIEGRAAIPMYLGHERPGALVGRLVELAYHDRALWGRLVGADPAVLVGMHAGAVARGREGLGVSIHARGRCHPGSGTVVSIDLLESVDVDSRSEASMAGGLVVFGPDGLPVAWTERLAYWQAVRAQAVAALEARVRELGQRRPHPAGADRPIA